MAGHAGWYVGRIEVASVAAAKSGSGTAVTDTVFQWTDKTRAPTVAAADITGLTAITGGPYPTHAAALAAAQHDPNTNTGTAGTGTQPGVSDSTTGSSGGHLPNPLHGLEAIGSFFTALESASTWERAAKVVIGAALILVGMAKLTGAGGAIKSAAGKVPVIV